MKIGIDARFLTHPQPGGFKTYTENLIAALANLDGENEYYLYVDREPTSRDVIPVQTNFHAHVIPGFQPMVGLPWREQIRLPKRIAFDKLDLFHSPCLTAPLNLNCALVITVHDMIWAFPERFSQRGTWTLKRQFMEWYNYMIPVKGIKRASAILTVSNAAKESIVENLHYPSEKIYITHEAAPPTFARVTDTQCLLETRAKYGLPSKFILAIGSADPRKNISTLLKAYSLLPRNIQQEYRLAVVWTHRQLADNLSTQLDALGLKENVLFLYNVTNENLSRLYSAASLFVFPSLYEGFGLPLLEAMACGCPVVAANTASIPEIVADAAILFDAKDAQEMSETIADVLSDPEVTSNLIASGLKRNANFSWEKCASETLSVYRHALFS